MSSVLLILLGIVSGILSGLLGVGGGVILVPGLIYLARLEIHSAIGVSLAVIVPTAFVGAYKHFLDGQFELTTALLVAGGGVCGAFIGAGLASTIPEIGLKRGFGVLLVVLGGNMIFGWSGSVAEAAAGAVEESEG